MYREQFFKYLISSAHHVYCSVIHMQYSIQIQSQLDSIKITPTHIHRSLKKGTVHGHRIPLHHSY